MNIVRVCKADPLGAAVPSYGVKLHIVENLPIFTSGTMTLSDWSAFADKQAVVVADALESLPQGVRHRVLGIMLQRHGNLYRGS